MVLVLLLHLLLLNWYQFLILDDRNIVEYVNITLRKKMTKWLHICSTWHIFLYYSRLSLKNTYEHVVKMTECLKDNIFVRCCGLDLFSNRRSIYQGDKIFSATPSHINLSLFWRWLNSRFHPKEGTPIGQILCSEFLCIIVIESLIQGFKCTNNLEEKDAMTSA